MSQWAEQLFETIRGTDPILVVLAGSNGAGKTTFYRTMLQSTQLPFVNADEVARALQPAEPGAVAYKAMRVAGRLREDLLARRVSFCMETVLSDTGGFKLGFMRRAKDRGYRVVVIFIRLESAQLSQSRVHHRVRRGGHDVPSDKLIARFPRTLHNAREALALANLGVLLDNSQVNEPYRWVETWIDGVRC
jgi:predicted ABC-type ATPase